MIQVKEEQTDVDYPKRKRVTPAQPKWSNDAAMVQMRAERDEAVQRNLELEECFFC